MELKICDLLDYVYQQNNKASLFLWSTIVFFQLVQVTYLKNKKIKKNGLESLIEQWEEMKFSQYVKLLFILKDLHNKEI